MVRYDDFYHRYMAEQIGKNKLVDFTPILIERLLQNMADEDFSTKTIRDVYNILNAMFKYAMHNRIISFNPCSGVEVPKTKKKEITALAVNTLGVTGTDGKTPGKFVDKAVYLVAETKAPAGSQRIL